MMNRYIKLVVVMLLISGCGIQAMDKPLPEKSKGFFSTIKDAVSSKLTPEKATQKLKAYLDSNKSKITLKDIEPLIAAGANIEVKNLQGKTILFKAVDEGNYPLVAFLLKSGANRNTAVPLARAAQNNNVNMIKELIAAKADVNATDENGFTALYHAAYAMNPASVKLLLDAGANVNVKTRSDNTPLHVVLTVPVHSKNKEKDEIISLLLSHGADTTIANNFKQTPAMLLKNTKHEPKYDETSLKLLKEMQDKREGKK